MRKEFDEIKNELNKLNGKIMTIEDLDNELVNIGFYSEQGNVFGNSELENDVIESGSISYMYNVGEENDLTPFVIGFEVVEKDEFFDLTKIKVVENY